MTADLVDLLATEPVVLLPGVHDALSARVAVASGAKALYMSGFAVAGTLLGCPDIGLVTASEMVERARQIATAAGGIPVVADGDNGYGGPLNVARLVRAYEQAGVACVQIEDQVNPKRCGHMAGKQVVPLEEACVRIRAAVAARSSSRFLIMARTDARACHGLSDALRRGEAFLDAGADLLFVEAPESLDEMRQIGRVFAGVPLVANMVEDGRTPRLPPSELASLGFRVVLYPISALLAVTEVLRACYTNLLQLGEAGVPRSGFVDFNALVGLEDLRDLEERSMRTGAAAVSAVRRPPHPDVAPPAAARDR